MPLCRLVWHRLSVRPIAHGLRWHQPVHLSGRTLRGLATADQGVPIDETKKKDGVNLYTLSADSSYLDFILGPSKVRQDVPRAIADTEPGTPAPSKKAQTSTAKKSKDVVHAESLARTVLRPTFIGGRKRVAGRDATRGYNHHESRLAQLSRRDRTSRKTLRAKFWALKSRGVNTGNFSIYWTTQFAALHAPYEHGSTDAPVKSQQLRFPTMIKSWVQEYEKCLREPEDKAQLSRFLNIIRWKELMWQSIALWLLRTDLKRVLDFLRLTATISPPTSCVGDCLKHIVARFEQLSENDRAEQFGRLIELFPTLAKRPDGTRLYLHGDLFHRILVYCSVEQAVSLHNAIKEHHVSVTHHTLLQFASYFAKHEEIERALDCLLEAKAGGADPGSLAFLSGCSTILRRSIRMPGGYRVCLRLFDNLVDIGVKLNTQLFNIIMLNAVEAGDAKTAFAVYDQLVDYAVEADQYTYNILLKACRQDIGNADMLNNAIRSAISHVKVLGESWLATEILNSLALHHSLRHPLRAYETVVAAYAQMFDVHPLSQLGLPLPTNYEQESTLKMQPSAAALGIMIRLFLINHHQHKRSIATAHDLYQRYRALVESRVEPFLSLTITDHVANAFLSCFVSNSSTLVHAALVIRDMQRPLPASSDSSSSTALIQCLPTQQSWSIFLNGFTRFGKTRLAEQVLTRMQSLGIEPDQVTWNHFVAGYANEQRAEKLFDTLRQMEADGATWDEFTMRNVRNFRDQVGLRRVMGEERQRRSEQVLDFTEDLKSSIQERLSDDASSTSKP